MNDKRPVPVFENTVNRSKSAIKEGEAPKFDPTPKKQNIEVGAALLNFNFDANNTDDFIAWIQQHIKNDQYTWRVYTVTKLDTANQVVTLRNNETGKLKDMRLPKFLMLAKQDVQFAQGDLKLDGKVVYYDDVFNMIKQDAENGRTHKGKRIISIDYATNTVTLESDSIFNSERKVSIDDFIPEYLETRKLGYGDTKTIEQDLTEQTRLKNIEDMTTAFRNALGIKAPKVIGVEPLKLTRQASSLDDIIRSKNATKTWTVEEIGNTYRTGKVNNGPIEVSGVLNNTFNPVAPLQKLVRQGEGLKILEYK